MRNGAVAPPENGNLLLLMQFVDDKRQCVEIFSIDMFLAIVAVIILLILLRRRQIIIDSSILVVRSLYHLWNLEGLSELLNI